MADFNGDPNVPWGEKMEPLSEFVKAHTNNRWVHRPHLDMEVIARPGVKIKFQFFRVDEEHHMTTTRDLYFEEKNDPGIMDRDARDFAMQLANTLFQHTTYRQREFIIDELQKMQERHEQRPGSSVGRAGD